MSSRDRVAPELKSTRLLDFWGLSFLGAVIPNHGKKDSTCQGLGHLRRVKLRQPIHEMPSEQPFMNLQYQHSASPCIIPLQP